MNRRNRRMVNGLLQDATIFTSQLSAAYVQPTVIVPAGHEQYYVFYWNPARQNNQLAYDLTYAVVDMRQQGGDGAVVRTGVVLARSLNPRVTAVRHADNWQFWVLTRGLDGRGFQAFRLGPVGEPISPAVVSLAGQTLLADLAELKAAPDGRHLVCSARSEAAGVASGSVCTYDFDPATGQVSREVVVRSVVLSPFYQNSPLLSASFSPDSRLLYTSEAPLTGIAPTTRRSNDIWQYDLSLGSSAAIAQSRRLVSDVPLPPNAYDNVQCLSLQLAPDGTLWAGQCYRRRFVNPATNQITGVFAAIIRRPNVYGPACGFEAEGYPYRVGHTPGILPNVITNMLYAPATLNFEAGCPGDSVRFWAASAGLPAGLRWDFGDPASGAANAATGAEVAHRYARPGPYQVRLTLADGQVLSQPVAVSASPADFSNQNVFTPNGDGLNEYFEPVRGPLPGARLQVFSRWGQRVFAADTPADAPTASAALRWDGSGASGGQYFWELTYPNCQGQPQRRRGVLTLVR